MPCRKCEHLESEYAAALAALRQSLAEFEREAVPTMAKVEELEQARRRLEAAVRALELHLSEHPPET
jgi:ribosomal 50S subunit-associated protein YjgA (DUF615 family)